jgi:hypothetical protein
MQQEREVQRDFIVHIQNFVTKIRRAKYET